MSFDSKTLLWPITPFGFEDGDEAGDQQNDQQQSNSGEPQGSSGQRSSDDDDDYDEYKGLSARELRRLIREKEERAKTAEQERDAAKNRLTEEERKKLAKEERLELESREKDSTIETLRATVAKQAIINGILSDRRYEWHNPEIVAQQLNSEVVKVSDDGKVENLGKELKRIANDESLKFLLAKDNTKQQQQQQNSGQQQASGLQPGQGGANGNGADVSPNIQQLAEIMPALRNRM